MFFSESYFPALGNGNNNAHYGELRILAVIYIRCLDCRLRNCAVHSPGQWPALSSSQTHSYSSPTGEQQETSPKSYHEKESGTFFPLHFGKHVLFLLDAYLYTKKYINK